MTQINKLNETQIKDFFKKINNDIKNFFQRINLILLKLIGY